jgi:hypothetical protein
MKTADHVLVRIAVADADNAAPSCNTGILSSLKVDWSAVVDYFVPIGYQDATGFHYGCQPARAEAA